MIPRESLPGVIRWVSFVAQKVCVASPLEVNLCPERGMQIQMDDQRPETNKKKKIEHRKTSFSWEKQVQAEM